MASYVVKLQKICTSYKIVHGRNEEDAMRIAKQYHHEQPGVFTWQEGETYAVDVDSVDG